MRALLLLVLGTTALSAVDLTVNLDERSHSDLTEAAMVCIARFVGATRVEDTTPSEHAAGLMAYSYIGTFAVGGLLRGDDAAIHDIVRVHLGHYRQVGIDESAVIPIDYGHGGRQVRNFELNAVYHLFLDPINDAGLYRLRSGLFSAFVKQPTGVDGAEFHYLRLADGQLHDPSSHDGMSLLPVPSDR